MLELFSDLILELLEFEHMFLFELLKRKVLQLAAYHRGVLTVSDLLTQDWCDLEEANHCFQDLQMEGHCHFRTTHQDRYVYEFPGLSNS